MCPIIQNQHIRKKPSITDALLEELLREALLAPMAAPALPDVGQSS